MGVIYIPLPIEGEVKKWLEDLNVTFPKDVDSRFPTLNEIKDVFSKFERFNIVYAEEKIGAFWEIAIEGKDQNGKEIWANLTIQKLSESLNPFTFEKGSPELVINIISKLAKYTGAFALTTDSGEDPIIITDSIDTSSLHSTWLDENK